MQQCGCWSSKQDWTQDVSLFELCGKFYQRVLYCHEWQCSSGCKHFMLLICYILFLFTHGCCKPLQASVESVSVKLQKPCMDFKVSLDSSIDKRGQYWIHKQDIKLQKCKYWDGRDRENSTGLNSSCSTGFKCNRLAWSKLLDSHTGTTWCMNVHYNSCTEDERVLWNAFECLWPTFTTMILSHRRFITVFFFSEGEAETS